MRDVTGKQTCDLSTPSGLHVTGYGEDREDAIMNAAKGAIMVLEEHIAALKTYIRWLEDEDWPEGLWEENRIRHGLRADLGLPEDALPGS